MICFASASVWNQFVSRHAARKVPLNDSTKALSVGLLTNYWMPFQVPSHQPNPPALAHCIQEQGMRPGLFAVQFTG